MNHEPEMHLATLPELPPRSPSQGLLVARELVGHEYPLGQFGEQELRLDQALVLGIGWFFGFHRQK
jgi:hypothetical protein